MDLKFSVNEKSIGNESKQPHLQCRHSVCAVSCENIVVFTKVEYHSNSFKQSIPVYTLCAADLNSPFETHVLKKSLDRIIKVTFDSNGHRMLVVTNAGNIHLYVKGSCLNQWVNTYTSNWNGEEILLAKFFHLKNKPSIQITDIKLNAPYSEKFLSKPHQPTLKTIGNCAQDGFFAITASGLIMACTINSSGNFEEEAKSVVGPIRDNFILATACLAPSGLIHISAWKPEIIKCWEIEVSFVESERVPSKEGKIFGGLNINGNRKLLIKVQSTQSFTPLPNYSDANKQKSAWQNIRVSHMMYADQEDPDSLLIALEMEEKCKHKTDKTSEKEEAGEKASHVFVIQHYQLIEKNRVFYKFFQDMTFSKEANNTTKIKEWVLKGEWNSNVRILSVNCPKRTLFPGSSIPYALVASTNDGTVYSINRDTMQTMNKYSFQNNRSDEMPPPKRLHTSKQLISLAPTWTNLHIVALDSEGGLHLLTLLKQSDVGSSWAVSVLLLFEYSLVTKHDFWDILLVTPLNSALTLSERLNENFNQHPPPIISNLQSKFLVLKNAMLRLSSNLHQRSIEAKIQAQLSSILKLFRSLRPITTDFVSGDKNVASIIQNYIESRNSLEFSDLDKSIENMLFSNNILDCQIDSSLGQNVQVFLQFSTDLSLYLLLLLVQNPKYELAKESKLLQNLREILFVARLWYRHNKLVVPQMMKKSDSLDIWAQLYKLLTRLAQIIPNEPDAGFLGPASLVARLAEGILVAALAVACWDQQSSVACFNNPTTRIFGVVRNHIEMKGRLSQYRLQFTGNYTPIPNIQHKQPSSESESICPFRH